MKIDRTLSGKKRPDEWNPTSYELAILNGIQRKHYGELYQATVPAHVVRTRRLKNRMARVSRRINRAGAR